MKQFISLKRIVFSVCIVLALLAAALITTGLVMNADAPADGHAIVAEAEEVTEPAEPEVSAEEAEGENSDGNKALAAGLAVGLAAAAGAVAMGIAVAKSSEATARQPEAEGKIRSSLMLGLVFIETAIIYALIVAILIIFVL